LKEFFAGRLTAEECCEAILALQEEPTAP
jgi:hypothetical protein